MDKILRVNMSELTVAEDPVPQAYQNLGGRGLTSRILLDEVEATCHPLGINNKLVVAPGVLSGTRCPNSGRLSIGGKSPLTGGIKEANAGTPLSHQLASLGYKAIIVEGLPENDEYHVLYISEQGARLEPAKDLAGLGMYAVNEKIRKRYHEKVYVMGVGQAGECRLSNAGISCNDPEGGPGRFAGRGGLGAVMGSKKLKAIVVDTKKIFDAPVTDKDKYGELCRKFVKILRGNPVSGQALPAYGTNVLMNIINEAGALPTRNFKYGRFEGANKVSGEELSARATARGGVGTPTHNCHPGCVILCSNIYPDENGEAIVSPIEYESAWALGPNLMIDDLDVVARLNRICNDVGLDTIEAGGALGVAMEAGVVSFGDGQGAIRLLEEVGKGTPLGHIIGQGAEAVGKAYGITRVATVKGQHMPAYDPRAIKGIGVTYAMTTMGADHTAGYSVSANILKSGGFVDPLKAEGQVELSTKLQIATAAIDSFGLCVFVSFSLLDDPEGWPTVVDIWNYKTGGKYTLDDVMEVGKEVLRVEREFNRRAGFTPAHDRLPEFFRTEPLPPHNTVFDVPPEEMDRMNEQFNMLR
ncbi:aldehyde ferredoxin oxidoreductase family protein [Sporomusa sp.]|uniref:aldehyde ferredoxin oxidoreductase family protein n=1 Tax=Sporomusa sp. TaxID=2078658 RepID=UPI002CA11512|nr:aldehyde ferredoxin oxidoreductase C-terminal domain-containing protein [Sporomusa sp.]HWR44858.1 aldehyde ferredoxin oxidoreductase C-terminal domain-containing protein [Sporomusa sp.]